MGFLSTAVGWFLSLGSSVIVMIVLIILGLIFRVGWQKAVRGGITTGVGLGWLVPGGQCDRQCFAASCG